MAPQTPIVNQPNIYVNGMATLQASSISMLLNAGAARDSTNTNDIILNSNTEVFINRVGADGLDTGTIAASTFYAMYAIGDSTGFNPTAGLLSLNASSPLLPAGYDMFRRVGWMLTSSISQTVRLWNLGNGLTRTYYYDPGPISVLTAGVATTFTSISLSAGIPPIVVPQSRGEACFILTYDSASAANQVDFAIPSAGPGPITSYNSGSANISIVPIWTPITLGASPVVGYRTTSGSDSVTLAVAGFRDYL